MACDLINLETYPDLTPTRDCELVNMVVAKGISTEPYIPINHVSNGDTREWQDPNLTPSPTVDALREGTRV